MEMIVSCTKCNLNYGKYVNFQMYPDDMLKEEQRHNCKLIQLCHKWLDLITRPVNWNTSDRGQYYGDLLDVKEQIAMLEAERRASMVKELFKVRTAAYMRAEARACSRIFAAAHANRLLLSYHHEYYNRLRHIAHVDDLGDFVQAHMSGLALCSNRAAVTERASRIALSDVVAKAEALESAMDEVEEWAREAGISLPPRYLVRIDDSRGVREDIGCLIETEDHPLYNSDEDDSEVHVMNILTGNNDENNCFLDDDNGNDGDDEGGNDGDDEGRNDGDDEGRNDDGENEGSGINNGSVDDYGNVNNSKSDD